MASGVTSGGANTPPAKRWSVEGWVLYRPDSGGPLSSGTFAPGYGASQAGAVLRYTLAPESSRKPQAYVRVTQAIAEPRETESALGVSARPVPGLPVRAMAELRVQRIGGETRLRPAALAVTELPPVVLPLNAQADIYAQAGYVGGDFATPFADGQVHVTRPFLTVGDARVRIGAGAWGGAQQGVSRIDVGPTASIDIPVGAANARIALDYRQRVAGNAMPGSGPALTVSTGF